MGQCTSEAPSAGIWERAFHVPVAFENDADAAAPAEALQQSNARERRAAKRNGGR